VRPGHHGDVDAQLVGNSLGQHVGHDLPGPHRRGGVRLAFVCGLVVIVLLRRLRAGWARFGERGGGNRCLLAERRIRIQVR
jgi:hypothetical protein